MTRLSAFQAAMTRASTLQLATTKRATDEREKAIEEARETLGPYSPETNTELDMALRDADDAYVEAIQSAADLYRYMIRQAYNTFHNARP